MRSAVAALVILSQALGVSVLAALPAAAQTPAGAAIAEGSTVQVEYTVKDDAGKVIDSNKGKDPLTYTQGDHRMIPGVERALAGMRKGDEKTFTVAPEDAYGPLDPRAEIEVAIDEIPAGARSVGAQLMATSSSGDRRPVSVKQVREKTVVLDTNHPLAGKTLVFQVKVLDVQPPR